MPGRCSQRERGKGRSGGTALIHRLLPLPWIDGEGEAPQVWDGGPWPSRAGERRDAILPLAAPSEAGGGGGAPAAWAQQSFLQLPQYSLLNLLLGFPVFVGFRTFKKGK